MPLYMPLRHTGRVEVMLQLFLTSTLVGGEGSASWPDYFTTWGKSPLCSLNTRLGGPQSQSGHFGGERNLLPMLGFEPWIVQRIA